MFGKAKCKLCGDEIRFALRHLKQKHSEVLSDKDVAKLNMSRIMEKYFDS
jgi:ribosome-binding protein aMBF1 (putative translation factor)